MQCQTTQGMRGGSALARPILARAAGLMLAVNILPLAASSPAFSLMVRMRSATHMLLPSMFPLVLSSETPDPVSHVPHSLSASPLVCLERTHGLLTSRCPLTTQRGRQQRQPQIAGVQALILVRFAVGQARTAGMYWLGSWGWLAVAPGDWTEESIVETERGASHEKGSLPWYLSLTLMPARRALSTAANGSKVRMGSIAYPHRVCAILPSRCLASRLLPCCLSAHASSHPC